MRPLYGDCALCAGVMCLVRQCLWLLQIGLILNAGLESHQQGTDTVY